MKNPEAAIIWILAFTLKIAKIKQAKVEHSIPKKKKYSSIISLGGKTLMIMRVTMTQLISNGISRSLVLLR